MKWLTYKRGTIPLHRVAMVILGVQKYSKRLCGGFVQSLYINKGKLLLWSWDKRQIRRLGQNILEELKYNQMANRRISRFKKYNSIAILKAEKIIKIDLSILSKKQLLKKYQELTQAAIWAQGATMLEVDAFDVVSDDFFKEKFWQELKLKLSQDDFLIAYKDLTESICETYTNSREKVIIKAALDKNLKNSAIEKIYSDFYWSNLGWENVKPYSLLYFRNQIKKYKKKKNLRKLLGNFEQRINQIKNRRNELVKKYNLSSRLLHWLYIIDQYTILHDLRKEMQVKMMYSLYLMLKEVAMRLDFSVSDLEWLWYDEVEDLIRGQQLNNAMIEKRKKAIAVLVNQKFIKSWSGASAIKYLERELGQLLGSQNFNSGELKGNGVTGGKVMGRVKVCTGAADALRKIKGKNDILICSMTLPDYVSAMRKAGAIVTDEGGITCHAAIIAREFNIPCIVGTKIATQVLKDGDLVEVDANQGKIKKV